MVFVIPFLHVLDFELRTVDVAVSSHRSRENRNLHVRLESQLIMGRQRTTLADAYRLNRSPLRRLRAGAAIGLAFLSTGGGSTPVREDKCHLDQIDQSTFSVDGRRFVAIDVASVSAAGGFELALGTPTTVLSAGSAAATASQT